MHDTRERLSLFWILALLELPVCGRACPVRYCWLARSGPTPSTMGSAGSAILMEIPIARVGKSGGIRPRRTTPASAKNAVGWAIRPTPPVSRIVPLSLPREKCRELLTAGLS